MMILKNMLRPALANRTTPIPTIVEVATALTTEASYSLANYRGRMNSISLNSSKTFGS